MANKQLNLIYALREGETIHVSEVESGLKCGCQCPACGDPLVAKKGRKMMHHFAHHAGHTCEYGYESSLHLAAKDIISNAKKFVIPAVYLDFPGSYKKRQLLFSAKEISVDNVKLEKRYGNIVPDIVIVSGGKEVFVEIFVTHSIDEIKLKKLKCANISTIEIDLSKQDEMITAEELSQILLNDSDAKTWKYNAVAQKYLNQFYKVSDQRRIIPRRSSLHIDYCPINARQWKGKPYANFMDDCLGCEYCISVEENDSIFCSGRLRISCMEDFDLSLEERIKETDNKQDDIKMKAFVSGQCPNCGCKLVQRKSQYGVFVGCSNYPHCRFVAVADPETGEIRMKS